MLNGKIHYFDWAIFNSKLFVYQRVWHSNLDILCCDLTSREISGDDDQRKYHKMVTYGQDKLVDT